MAYNELDVTTAKADVAYGPVYYNPRIITVIPGIDFEPLAEDGWVKLGETSTEGYSWEQSADEKQKLVMSKNLGSAYTNFADKLTIQFASSLDIDVLGVVFGRSNVSVDADGTVMVAVRNRQPEYGTLLVNTITDDGRRRVAFCPRAQPDINVSYTWNEDDITVFETVFNLTTIADLANHYELIEGRSGDVEVLVDPTQAQVAEALSVTKGKTSTEV